MTYLSAMTPRLVEDAQTELRTRIDQYRGRSFQTGRTAFRHLDYSFDRRREHARDDATRALSVVAGKQSDLPATAAGADPYHGTATLSRG